MLLAKIKYFRDRHNLTQAEIAKIMGVSKSTYGRWETGEAIIPLYHLNNLCNYFKVSMDYMTGLSDDDGLTNYNLKLNKELIGKRLKAFRLERGLTQEDLASRLNTSHSTISAYENGKTMLLTAFAFDIAKKYDVSLDFLCGRTK